MCGKKMNETDLALLLLGMLGVLLLVVCWWKPDLLM